MNIKYSRKEKNMYVVGVLGQSMIYEIIGTGFSYYLQSVIFIPTIIIGVLTTIGKILDALKNPIMGVLVDRTNTKWGKCRPYLLFTPFFICIATIFCFINGTYSVENSFMLNSMIIFWASFSYLLWGIVFAATDVPLWSIIPLITSSEHERSKLLVSARNISNIGCGIVSFFIVYLSQFLGRNFFGQTGDDSLSLKYGVIFVSVFLSIISSIMFQMAGLFTHERIKPMIHEKKSIKQNLNIIWNCEPFKKLLISGLLRSPVSLMRKLQLTLLTYYYGDNGNTAYINIFILLGGGYMISQFVAISLVPQFVKKVSKNKLYYNTIGLSIIPYTLLFVIYFSAYDKLDEGIWLLLIFIIFVLIGASAGLISALQSLLIADIIDYEEYQTGYRPDALFSSLPSFLSNFSGGIASLITGIVFSMVGFSGNGIKAVNYALSKGASFKRDIVFRPYRLSMFIMCSLIPAIGLAISLIPIKKYDLDDKKHTYIITELKKIRE